MMRSSGLWLPSIRNRPLESETRSCLIDTSVVVRYLTGKPAALAERARRLIESETTLILTETVVLETSHVLRTLYGIGRTEIVDALIEFIQRVNVLPLGIREEILVAALLLSRPSGRVSIADALTWAAARNSEVNAVCTFDRRFPSEGVALTLV